MNTEETKELALVNFTQSWRLKALGFNLPCCHFYDEKGELYYDINSVGGAQHCNEQEGEYSAPTVEHALQWMRDDNKLDCYVQINCWNNSRARWFGVLPFADGGFADKQTNVFDMFAQASSAMLDEALSAMGGACDLDSEKEFDY